MKSVRNVLFWAHLSCGAAAGVVIIIMSVTGVALTYGQQMLVNPSLPLWVSTSR